ncbi:MAG: signal peptide peptidase SppA [Porticoccaceae bacterium]|nr:signal peptide peptidase SppA [Porticoccaceae bacterium]
MSDDSAQSNRKSGKKSGLIRRFFSLLGGIGKFVRSAINMLFLVFFVLIIGSMFSSNIRPLPAKAFLKISPSGMLVEQLTYADPLVQIMEQSAAHASETLLADLVEAIDDAAKDARITGLVLELDFLAGGGLTKLNILGAALTRFKASGKPVIAAASNFSQEQYYLASFADEIHLNPMGMVLVTGYGAYRTYFKEGADKLGINFHVFKVGDYKDAVEPFIRNDMSEYSKQQTRSWINELWQAYTSQVETNRALSPGAIDTYISEMDSNLEKSGGNIARLALDSTLIDHISTRPALLKHLQTLAGKDPDDKHDYLNIGFQEYLFHKRLKPQTQQNEAKVGLIIAKGTIYDGEQLEGSIGSLTLSGLLQEAREDKQIKALVIRVDSPGGSAFASDVIRQEIDITRESGTPVVVSMGSVAASGGYWIAANVDQVWASATTITGSIGVFGLIPTFERTFESLGIHSDGVGTSPLADIYRLDRPMSEPAGRIIQLNVENIYQQFLNLVATGRNLPSEEVHRIAQGRVWTGAQAEKLGLVDQLGDLDDAIKSAAQLAGLEHYDIKPVERDLDFREQVLKQLGQRVAQLNLKAYFGSSNRLSVESVVKQQLQLFADKLGFKTPVSDPGGLYLECIECRQF